MATDFVKDTPVDEALYPSYDEASAAVNEQYAQGAASVAQFGDEIATNTTSLQDQVLGDMAQLPGNITMPEAMGASAGYEDILELVSAELAIMQTSLDQNIQMSNNMMQNYIESMEAGLPMFEKYVDSRLESLETRFGGTGSGLGPGTDEEDPEDDPDDDARALQEAADALGMPVEEAFPHVGSPLQGFSWANVEELQDVNGLNVGGILADMYGVHDRWDKSGFYNVDGDGVATLKKALQEYSDRFNLEISRGASNEVANLLAMGAMKLKYGEDLSQLENMGGVTPAELTAFTKIHDDVIVLTNGGTPDVTESSITVQTTFSMPDEDTYEDDEGNFVLPDKIVQEEAKEDQEEDIRILGERIPRIRTKRKTGDVSDDVLKEGLLALAKDTFTEDGRYSWGDTKDVVGLGATAREGSLQDVLDAKPSDRAGDPLTFYGKSSQIGMADEDRTDAERAAMALLASEGFSPNVNVAQPKSPSTGIGVINEAMTGSAQRVVEMYEKALAKKKAQEEAYMRAMADKNVRAQAREQQIVDSGSPPKLTYDPADFSNFAVF